MKNIADLLLRVWQKSQPRSDAQVAVIAENRDRSSMADFVRILQACDQERYGRNQERDTVGRCFSYREIKHV